MSTSSAPTTRPSPTARRSCFRPRTAPSSGAKACSTITAIWDFGIWICSNSARDTQRNLRLFAFIRSYAGDERIKMQFEQWRPYVQMMHTRAVAMPLLAQRAFAEGLRVIEAGIEAIRDFLDQYNQSHRAEECIELVSLECWRDEILGARKRRPPRGPRARSGCCERNSMKPLPPSNSKRPPGSAMRYTI